MSAPEIALTALAAKWSGPSWPPESEILTGSSDVTFEGVIVMPAPRRVELRRSDVLQGYLASKKTTDVAQKYTELTVKLTSAKGLEAHVQASKAGFLSRVEGGSSRFLVGSDVVKVWANPNVVGELAAALQTVSDPLMQAGDALRFTFAAGTFLARNVSVLSLTKRLPKEGGMHGQTHMYGAVQGGPVRVDEPGGFKDKIFAAKVGLPGGGGPIQPPTNPDVKDEEWD